MKPKFTNVSFDRETWDWLKRQALSRHRSINSIVGLIVKKEVKKEVKKVKNILDQIMLSPHAVDAWEEVAERIAATYPDADPGMEEALQLEDGSLLIYCEVGDGRVASLTIPAAEWAWMD